MGDGAGVDDAAEARYRRVTEAIAALSEMAVGPSGARLAEVLSGDDVALARMRAAVEVVRAAGLAVGSGGGDGELLRESVAWQRYSRGPVSPLHAGCGEDISRGLLRIWARRKVRPRDRAVARRARLRQARMQLLGQVRTGCAALRAELRSDAAGVTLRQVGSLRAHIRRRAAQLAGEIQDAVGWELHGLEPGPPAEPVGVDLPPQQAAGLEHRLTLLLGAGFGAGAALSLGRVWTEFLPGPAAVVVSVSAAAGVALGAWVVRTRRLLCERAALDRWVCEVTAVLRSALDEHVASRVLAAEIHRFHDDPSD